MIYAVDFDGTISMAEWPEVGQVNKELVDFLIRRKMYGDKIILWTCRAGKPLKDAVDFCKSYGLVFDAVNDNLPEIVEKYGSNSRKITCDVYIDDRACHVDDYDYTGEVDMDRIESALVRFADRVAMAGWQYRRYLYPELTNLWKIKEEIKALDLHHIFLQTNKDVLAYWFYKKNGFSEQEKLLD